MARPSAKASSSSRRPHARPSFDRTASFAASTSSRSPSPFSASSPSSPLCTSAAASPSDYPNQLPFIPTLAVTSPTNYGRIDPENESNLSILTSVADDSLRRRPRLPNMPGDYAYASYNASASISRARSPRIHDDSGDAKRHRRDTDYERSSSYSHHSSRVSPLLAIPSELIDTILSHLSPCDLAIVSGTCHALRDHAISDIHWQRHVQHHVPGAAVNSTGPCATYRELYVTHDRLWFLPKYKIWFCDRDLTGKMIIARYDPRRGCIEGYQMLAISKKAAYQHWPADHQVIIHSFEPHIKLHLDKPVLQFRVQDRQEDGGFSERPGANRFADEMPMALDDRLDSMYSNFLLTRPLKDEDADERLSQGYPYGFTWPPPSIPARHHVSSARAGQPLVELSPEDRPRCRSQVSDQTFRIRQWIEMGGTPAAPMLMGQTGGFAGRLQIARDSIAEGPVLRGGPPGIHIGEEVITYSTLDPVLYTPTPTKPWRGIWVGDYSGHGCEFLLIHQPDDPPASDPDLGLVRTGSETDSEWEKRSTAARVYRGSLECIKLTGDPNVPRGERTFVADDLGPAGHVGVATDAPFTGAKVVRSRGHVAATGYLRDKYIESQLLLISPNRLAQYWVEFGHISYFERVNIDDFLAP